VIAVIGPNWLTAQEREGPGRRLDDPDDRLRRELEAAIRRGVPVIPLLVSGARTPAREELPESLQPLVDWQSVVFSDKNARGDFEALADAIRHAVETEPGELALGSTFAGYEIEAYLGRGGMGVVYSARNLGLGRFDAVKVIAPVLSRDMEFRARFAGESRLAASVRHPNLLTVYTAGEESGLLYLAMQLVNGPDLARMIREARSSRGGRPRSSAPSPARSRQLTTRDSSTATSSRGTYSSRRWTVATTSTSATSAWRARRRRTRA
jgi:hypothetical protein